MKVAPLVRALETDNDFQPILTHTGQHYDDRMSGQFFRDLGLGEPAYFLEAGSGSHAQQTAEIMKRFEPVVLAEKPAAVVVVGDVNSTIACALVSAKLGIPVVHVEAGLRSFDRSMPEEINRLATDAITDVFLVTEDSGVEHLQAEGVASHKIHLIGNLMIDSLHWSLAKADHAETARRLGVVGDRYGLVTLHRPANVDSPEALAGILSALDEIGREVPLYFPVHPRTRQNVGSGAAYPGVHLLEPLGHIDFLGLMRRASIVLTDSGGIQEETTALGIPCLTLRENTERPVTIRMGTNRLAGTNRDSILQAWREHSAAPKAGLVPPLWDGQAAARACDVLRKALLPANVTHSH
jgi:UDP-N-acetylglucosamine 2-epimerase (non-hydrolysing)